MKRTTYGGQLGRYFLHGIFYSILMSIMLLAWVYLFAILTAFGFIIGLVIGFVLLFVIMGAINAFVTENVWDVKIQASFGTDLAHGFVLFLALLVVSFPVSIVFSYLVPTTDMNSFIIKYVIQLIILAFLDGYVAKNIAESFQVAGRRHV